MRLLRKLVLAGVALASFATHAQTFTGVQGTGWREVAMPASSSLYPTAQSLQTYDAQRPSVLYQIDDATGLANSPLPQVVKDNILRDGLGDGPVFVDRDIANAIADGTAATRYAAYAIGDSSTAYNSIEGVEQPSGLSTIQSVTAQGLFCRSGWRDYAISKSFPVATSMKIASVAGGSLSFDGKAQGSVNAQIVLQYKKSDWSLCIPYVVRFKQASAQGSIDLNNSRLALTASASTSFTSEPIHDVLYRGRGSAMIGPIPVWWDYSVPLDIGYQVLLNAAATTDFGSNLSGKVTFNYVCSNGGCSGTRDTSTVNFSSASPTLAVQMDATFDPYVKVGVKGRLYPVSDSSALASAGMAFKFSTPFQVYGYYGNACGDSDQDGTTETANTYFIDWQARLSLETNWSVFNSEHRQYIGFDNWAAQKINGALYRVLNNEGRVTPLWHKSLYFQDWTPAGKTSIFSPVLRLQSSAVTSTGYSYVVRTSMRSCAALDTNYRVNILSPNGAMTTVTVNGRNGYTDTTFTAATPSLVLRPVGTSDDDGRSFTNSGDAAPAMNYAPPPPVAPPPAPSISLPDGVQITVAGDQYNVSKATLTLASNGVASASGTYSYMNSTPQVTAPITSWAQNAPTTVGSGVEVLATVLSSSGYRSGPIGSWVSLSAAQSWSVTYASYTCGGGSLALQLQFRDAISHASLGTRTVTLQAKCQVILGR